MRFKAFLQLFRGFLWRLTTWRTSLDHEPHFWGSRQISCWSLFWPKTDHFLGQKVVTFWIKSWSLFWPEDSRKWFSVFEISKTWPGHCSGTNRKNILCSNMAHTGGTLCSLDGSDRYQVWFGSKILLILVSWNISGSTWPKVPQKCPKKVTRKCPKICLIFGPKSVQKMISFPDPELEKVRLAFRKPPMP